MNFRSLQFLLVLSLPPSSCPVTYKEIIFEILALQKLWSMLKSDPMQKRKDLLEQLARELEYDLDFQLGLDHLKVDAGGVLGKNGLVPWVRVFDPAHSPNATVGWYVVILFPFKGEQAFISLNHGTNSVHAGGQLKREKTDLIRRRTVEARAKAMALNAVPPGTTPEIHLQAPKSSRNLAEGYEHGNVCAFVLTKGLADFDSYLIQCIRQLDECRKLIDDAPSVFVSEKDYKTVVHHPRDEQVAKDTFMKDPEKLERALKAHIDTQNLVAQIIKESGYYPLSPDKSPNFDLAWKSETTFWVVEVKSLPKGAEVSQIRLGLGQLLHYKEELRKKYPKLLIKPILALEKRPPYEETWRSICDDAHIGFSYGPEFKSLRKVLASLARPEKSE
jgi:hypothetical protein